jgi:cell division protein FtsL
MLKEQKREKLFTIIFICLIFVTGMLVLNRYTVLAEKNLQITRLNRQLNELKSQNGHLSLNVAKLKSVDRIEGYAVKELGMIKPTVLTYVFVNNTQREEVLAAKEVDRNKDFKTTGLFSLAFNFLSRSIIWENN